MKCKSCLHLIFSPSIQVLLYLSRRQNKNDLKCSKTEDILTKIRIILADAV